MNAPSRKPICDTDPSRRGGIDEGWIEWSGRKRSPVEPDVRVEVLLRCERDGNEYHAVHLPAEDVEWGHAKPPSPLDVVAYRLVRP